MKIAYLLFTFFCMVASKTTRGIRKPIIEDSVLIQQVQQVQQTFEDVFVPLAETCAPDCQVHYTYDEYCDEVCYNEECNWDNGACNGVLTYCGEFKCQVPSWSNDAYCDWECYSEDCQFDNVGCEGVEFCANYCRNDMHLGNGQCDQQCNNEACEYDRGDCA